jgi:hypothetical protein
MTPAVVLLAAGVLLQSPAPGVPPSAAPPAHISAIEVRGNHTTTDEVVIGIAGVKVGDPFTDQTLAAMKDRLEKSNRFAAVDVLKRYQSLTDFSAVLVLISVTEREGVSVDVPMPGPMRVLKANTMWLPVLRYEDGYGFTYGARVSFVDVLGKRSRLSVPLTWGGERRAGIELEKRLDSPRLTRFIVNGTLIDRENPAYEASDVRQQVSARAERAVSSPLRLGAWSGFDHVSFGGEESRLVRVGADAAVDTRVDPMLSRNAVYIRGAIERLDILDGGAPLRTLIDANGYLGGPGPTTIAVRAYRNGANDPVPPYLKMLLGRDSTLRGVPSGVAAGDSTAAGTIELRVPVSSPLNIAKLGVRGFVDAATVYDAGEHLTDQRFDRSIGAGVWVTFTVIRIALDVARDSRGTTRVQLNSGLLF